MINKEQAARRLVHAAIRNIVRGEDPVANHVLVMAAHDILREYREAKKIVGMMEFADYIKPEHLREAVKTLKRGYYFLKHSRDDADETFDEANLTESNEAITAVNCLTFSAIFGSRTTHMVVLLNYVAVGNPQVLKDDARETFLALPVVKELAGLSRSEHLAALRATFESLPDLKRERAEDTALSAGQAAGAQSR